MSSGSILIVPACEEGRGGGHLGRSAYLFERLREKGRDACLWLPERRKDGAMRRFPELLGVFERFRGAPGEGSGPLLSREEELPGRNWDFIVLDRFRTSEEEFAFWANLGPLVGIDEGGPRRDRFDFLIDLLPALPDGRPRFWKALTAGFGREPNAVAPGLLPLPRKRRPPRARGPSQERGAAVGDSAGQAAGSGESPDGAPLRLLVSFGAEDSAGLGLAAARALAGAGQAAGAAGRTKPPLEITLVAPAPPRDGAGGGIAGLENVIIAGKIPGLKERLAEYDLFITHFGLGAFEAVYARLPVLLVSPSAYHEKLSRNAGFFSLGRGEKALRRLERIDFDRAFLETLNCRGKEIARRFGLEEDQKEDAGSFINGLRPRSPGRCPVCGEEARRRAPVLARFPGESYRRCPRCGILFQSRLNPPPIEYGKDYFFDSYKKQYGKTYLEDFPHLVEMGRKRLARIRSLLNLNAPKFPPENSPAPSLLDIGCAYGPFLAAAAEGGFSPAGIEPAEDAARYVKEELGFPVRQGFFPLSADDSAEAPAAPEGGYDAVTLWYAIEHFEEPGRALREIRGLLKDGGALAFSTPSFSGISGRASLRSFLKNSPPDHWTVWSPRICKAIFKKNGFRLRKIVVSGHHPERFPVLGRFAKPGGRNPLYRLLSLISRVFRLGDTFEAYGVKAS